MNALKKQTAGTYITFLAFLLSVVSVIVYYVNINMTGYFQNAAVSGAISFAFTGIDPLHHRQSGAPCTFRSDCNDRRLLLNTKISDTHH